MAARSIVASRSFSNDRLAVNIEKSSPALSIGAGVYRVGCSMPPYLVPADSAPDTTVTRNRELAGAVGISKSNLYEHARKPARKPDSRHTSYSDEELLPLIEKLIRERPTYGYRRLTAVLNREFAASVAPVVNHKRIHRIMHQHDLTWARRFANQCELMMAK